jgi:hypothetical protein
MRRADRLLELDAAIVAAARTTAAALDRSSSPVDVAMLGRVHLAMLTTLLAGRDKPADDELDRFLASLRTTEVRDTADG